MSSNNLKPRKAPAFQLYADDFLAGTSEMSAEEVGGYIRLLCHQWTKGGIPNDEDRAGRMAGLMGSPSLRYVLAKFTPCEDGMLRNERLERIRAEKKQYSDNQSQSGAKGAAIRWGKWQTDGDPNGLAMATPLATPLAKAWPEDSSPSPSPNKNTSELVYEAYPKKVARGAALKAIAKALKTVPFETLLARTKAYAESVSGSDPKYIPHPATWFNQERYLDDAVSCQPSAGSVTTKPEKPLSPLQRKIEELKARMVAHPGSPFNLLQYPRPTAAEDRKAYQKLDEELDALMFPDRAKQVPVDVGDDSEFRFGKETAA